MVEINAFNDRLRANGQWIFAGGLSAPANATVIDNRGDAGIENALALCKHNTVILMNRSEEFNSCKDGNRDLILAAHKAGRISIL